MEDKIAIDRSTLEGWARLTSPDSLETADPAWVCGFLHFAFETELLTNGALPYLKIIK